MARSMWKGAIQFGLVTIPVKLYLATESKGVSFNMLHADLPRPDPDEDLLPDRRRLHRAQPTPFAGTRSRPASTSSSPTTTWRRCRSRPSDRIEIEQFVPVDAASESTRFVKQAYYLEPDPIARKAFYLLKQTLAEKGLRAIGKIVLKDREQLAALDPFASTMLLSTLHWPDEIRSSAELHAPRGRGGDQAGRTADGRAAHRDDDPRVRRRRVPRRVPRRPLMSIIEAKAAGDRDDRTRAGPHGEGHRPDGRPGGEHRRGESDPHRAGRTRTDRACRGCRSEPPDRGEEPTPIKRREAAPARKRKSA